MITLFEIDQFAQQMGVNHYEILLNAYYDDFPLSEVCCQLAKALISRMK